MRIRFLILVLMIFTSSLVLAQHRSGEVIYGVKITQQTIDSFIDKKGIPKKK